MIETVFIGRGCYSIFPETVLIFNESLVLIKSTEIHLQSARCFGQVSCDN